MTRFGITTWIVLLAIAGTSAAQDAKLTELSAASTWNSGDLLYTVLNPATTPAQRKMTIDSLLKVVTSENGILVAASDSPDSIKAVANYTCDGTEDETQINAAIAALPAAGGVVVLGPGNFTAEGITLVEGVQLRGAGMYATKISLPAGASSAMFVSGAEASFDGGGLFDLELYGDAGKTQNGLDFSACTLVMEFFVERCKLSYFAIGIRGAEAGTANDRFLCVNDCDIWYCTTGVAATEHPRLHNVDFRNNTVGLTGDLVHCPVSFCKFVSNGTGVTPGVGNEIKMSSFGSCIFFANTNVALEIHTDNYVTGCILLGGTAGTNVGIKLHGGRNAITGNKIGAASYRFDGGAIVFDLDSAIIYDNSITGNSIYVNAGPALLNTATAGGGTGEVRDTAFVGNTIKIDTANPAVLDLSQGGRISNWLIASNVFDVDVAGITCIDLDDTNAVGNMIIGNEFAYQGVASVASTGITADLRNSLIAGNRFRFLDTPITIENSDSGTRIYGNQGYSSDAMERVCMQGAPTAVADGDTAITAAELLTGILTMASSTAGRAPTVPTGTAVNGVILVGQYIDWSFINTGNQTVTITAAANHTLVGAMAIPAGKSGAFRTRCSAANTAITYRMDGG